MKPKPTELFGYQLAGAQFAKNKRFTLIADEMGLGKSAQAVRVTDESKPQDVIVLCPAIARFNWQRQFEKFGLDERSFNLIKSREDRAKPGVNICSYDLLIQADVYYSLADLTNTMLIIDESHYLKNEKSKRTQAVYGFQCEGTTGLIARAAKVVFLSGTPAPNYSNELWTMLRATGVVKYSYRTFLTKFCEFREDSFGQVRVFGNKNIPELKALLKPFMIRRLKKEVMPDMPPIIIDEIIVDAEGSNPFEFFPSSTFDENSPQKFLGHIANFEQRLQHGWDMLEGNPDEQIQYLSSMFDSTSTLRRWIGVCKINAVIKWVEEQIVQNGLEKIVIFAWHQVVIEYLRKRLNMFGAISMYGGTPEHKRERKLQKFEGYDKYKVFIANSKAAGIAIDLTVADTVLLMEPSWVPGENAQAIARCHRITSEKAVNAYFITLKGSIDEHINKVLVRKTEQLTEIFDV